MKIMISVTLIFGLVLYPMSLSQNVAYPAWEFKNAYLEYNATSNLIGIKENFTIKYIIINVYQNNGSFTYYENLTSVKYKISENLTNTGNSSDPNGFPAVSTNDLNYLNDGQVPEDMKNFVRSVTKNIQIKVPAGTYITDKIVNNDGSTEYIDQSTGIVVYENITLLGFNTILKLNDTNIQMINMNIVFIIITVIILVLIFIVLAIYARKKK